ncbi:UNVERIFIED_CONTAM: hypothetical protein Sradi_5099200 [Sesamum radiatum]|uniref:Uncharacterized protein n=1 Tax=Sesamum radiatum TaxID=300843 RepID=A0AAW2M3A3_SESRA
MIGRGPDLMRTRIWDDLVEKHWSGENYKGECKIAQKNRMTEKDGSITKHTGGSIPQGAHKLQLEKVLGREVGELELFHRTHRRNKGIGEFVDNKSKKVNSSFDLQLWCEVIGGPSKGRIYGFGRSQSSDGYSKTSVTSTFRESEERFNELRKEMDEKYNELTMKMQEEFLRQEEESKRILEQALEESRKREENSQRRTFELEEMVRKLIQEVGYTNRRFAGGCGHKQQQDFGGDHRDDVEKMSKKPLTITIDNNKLNSTNYNDWLRNLRIVLNFENKGYVFDKPLPTALPKGSLPEERVTFDK